MAEVPHMSTVAQPRKNVESKETLVSSLDYLLECYLHLLDQYQILQQSLARLLSRVTSLVAKCSFGLVLNWHRVIYHLLKPTFQIRIVFATARTITMIECKHQLVCTAPVFEYNAILDAPKLLTC